ncbi:hypothetical protein [Geoalkalibacter halelectricus]|uniref:Uncharacterized protein n=1 Tax=Geoalkalibacter halelectricus TaxID=2847045 RepID=A0ABY5ZIA7_9BACT|nr:hypothetical protein [Geoalkalibacter halelectricus]MDO3377243.1 hypothetical protein [Geoalkalibacter halelectricus]UWZ78882.1 hypothetical protein L9S41_14510 [Geoalkalibacter halelectricus]
MLGKKFCLVLLFLLWATTAAAVDIPLDRAPVRGPADAPVTIIEFVDFQ